MALEQRLPDLAEDVPPASVTAGLFDRARRRYWLRRAAAAAAGLGVLLAAGYTVTDPGPVSPAGDALAAGLPERIVNPPWWTDTLARSPSGPVAVAFNGRVPQADSEDLSGVEFWRDGYTTDPTVVVGLYRDTYRIVRGALIVGVELSPDGRYLVREPNTYRGGNAEVLDLTTGAVRSLSDISSGSPLGWSADGRWLLVREGSVALMVSWPSGRVDWRVTYDQLWPAGMSGIALSPDGSLLAISTDTQLAVYRRDGTLLWQRAAARTRIAGRAAWIGNGMLAVLRSEPVCPGCPGELYPNPSSTWTLAFIDGLTGADRPSPQYPQVHSAFQMRVVAWRQDTAYAIVKSSRPVELVRLAPGAVETQPVFTVPDGVSDMSVATDYIDTVRPTGSPITGVNLPEVLVRSLCLLPLVAPLALLLLRHLRRRRNDMRQPAVA